MKTTRSFLLLAVLSPAALWLSGCARSGDVQSAAQTTKAVAKDLAADVATPAADSWAGIKDYTFEKRTDFAAGLDRLMEKQDAGLAAMNAKLTGLPDAAAKERDHAVKQFNEARSFLKSELDSLRTGTAGAWTVSKEKVTVAWQRTEAAYEKVKASPTS